MNVTSALYGAADGDQSGRCTRRADDQRLVGADGTVVPTEFLAVTVKV